MSSLAGHSSRSCLHHGVQHAQGAARALGRSMMRPTHLLNDQVTVPNVVPSESGRATSDELVIIFKLVTFFKLYSKIRPRIRLSCWFWAHPSRYNLFQYIFVVPINPRSTGSATTCSRTLLQILVPRKCIWVGLVGGKWGHLGRKNVADLARPPKPCGLHKMGSKTAPPIHRPAPQATVDDPARLRPL